MLKILDLLGNDLVLYPPAAISRSIATGTSPVAISCQVVETDTNLMLQSVSAEVDWNDSSVPVHYPASSPTAVQSSPLVLNLARSLGLGTYEVVLIAHNNRAVPDEVKVIFEVVILPLKVEADPPRYVYGPILPRDNGSPNRSNWLFDSASDLLILESSVRMLLLTVKGERLMLPDYGTNLRRMVFDLNIESIDAMVTQEVTQAIGRYEPRVLVQAVSVRRDANNRSVNLDASFMSRLSAQPFQINLQIV